MKRLHLLGLTCVCLGIAAMLLFRAGKPAIAATQGNCGSWNFVPSPNPTGISSNFNGVATIAPGDIWAVGETSPNSSSPTQTLIEHWNGTTWSIMSSPNPGSGSNTLAGVTAVSTNNVWAVGLSSGSSFIQALIEHWNGTTWSVVPSPNLDDSDLYAVAAVSATDIWAVGERGSQSLIERWNGSQWSIVPSPTNVRYPSLDSVATLSASDAWAVGVYYPKGTIKSYTLVEHWDGSRWSVVPSPNPSSSVRYVVLSGVAAVSANDIWAAGSYGTSSSVNPLIEHWNGTKWSITYLTQHVGDLSAVAVISATDIWTVGGSGRTLTEHWDGSEWSVVPSPKPGEYTNRFLAVASIPGSNYVWAVGEATYQKTTPFSQEATLTAYYC